MHCCFKILSVLFVVHGVYESMQQRSELEVLPIQLPVIQLLRSSSSSSSCSSCSSMLGILSVVLVVWLLNLFTCIVWLFVLFGCLCSRGVHRQHRRDFQQRGGGAGGGGGGGGGASSSLHYACAIPQEQATLSCINVCVILLV